MSHHTHNASEKTSASLFHNYDLSLPDWGPYSKNLFGVSHIADRQKGARFDLSVIPGIRGRPLAIPDVMTNSGYLPWEASVDLNYYSYRQQIEWKDKVYCDISFSKISDNCRLIRGHCVNNSAFSVPMALHFLSMPRYPHPWEIVMNADNNAHWLDALNCLEIHFSTPDFRNGISRDATRRGQVFDRDCMNGGCIGKGFGENTGDYLVFKLPTSIQGTPHKVLARFRLNSDGVQHIKCNGVKNMLHGTARWRETEIFRGKTESAVFVLESGGGPGFDIDGLIVIPENIDSAVSFQKKNVDTSVSAEPGPCPNSRVIQCGKLSDKYGLWWNSSSCFTRHYSMPDIMKTFRYTPGIARSFKPAAAFKTGSEHAFDVVIQPLIIEPNRSQIVHAVICNGSESEIETTLKNCLASADLEEIFQHARNRKISHNVISNGKAYSFSQERVAAVVMTNIVYPIRHLNRYIKHHTPGRLWDSLYTWDSGFIGLGLLELDLKRAIENLNSYVTLPNDEENAFIDHGSWVPTQIYLFNEILNRQCPAGFSREFYPRLRQYYRFFTGQTSGSTTATYSRPGLLCAWDYFYNSGGWDDYPPQWEIHSRKLNAIAPAVTTSHAIRCAKLLKYAAKRLGLNDDVTSYENDVVKFSEALQKYSWDSEAGYFSYVKHNEQAEPIGFFRHEASDTNYNMGLDGVTPLFAGICAEEQQNILWEKLSSSKHLWTQCGLSTVDQTAPYYRDDGYWNGSVWMPYQWFFWKAALDHGLTDFAWKIASTILDLWQQETQESYCCYEHFDISSGRGAGWHHFSALSTPVMLFYGAYFASHRLTGGFNIHFDNIFQQNDKIEADIGVDGEVGKSSAMIAALGQDHNWHATYNENPIPMFERSPGIFELKLANNTNGVLRFSAPPH